MGKVNCLRCCFRHEDNGNCTAVGGFCTAVPAAHCPMLREYLDTGLTPAEVRSMSGEWRAMMSVLNSIGGGYDRLRELAEADKGVRETFFPEDVIQCDLPGPPPMDYDLKYALVTLTEVDKKIMAALGML